MDRFPSRNRNISVNNRLFYKKSPSIPKKYSTITTTQPYREIRIGSLSDDFYSNLLDWYNDRVYFAINNSIFIHDFVSTKTSFIYKSDFTITSIKSSSNKILVGMNNGEMDVVDINKKKSITIKNHMSRIGIIKTDNNNRILTGSRDTQIKIVDIRSTKVLDTIIEHSQEVCGIELNRNRKYLLTGGNDNKLCVFDYRNLDKPLKNCLHHKAAVRALSWSPISQNLFVSGGGTQDKTIKTWDMSLITNSFSDCLLNSTNFGSQVCNLKWLMNNQIISTHGYSKNDIRLSVPVNFHCIKQFLGHRNRVIHFAMSPDEKFFATGAGDSCVKFWEVKNEDQSEIKIR